MASATPDKNPSSVHISRSGSITVSPPKLNSPTDNKRLSKLDEEFQQSINRLSAASYVLSPGKNNMTTTMNRETDSKSPYQLELEHAKRREEILKERLRSSQKILEQQRQEANLARDNLNFRNEIARRIELDAATRDMAVAKLKNAFEVDAAKEVEVLESKLGHRRSEILRQTRSQLNLDFTRRIEEQHKEFEIKLDDEVRNMAAKMTRAHQDKLKDLAHAYLVREKQKKSDLEKRMRSIEITEEENLVNELSKKQVEVLTKMKAELQFQMEQRLAQRKREIEKAHQQDRRARLLEVGKEIKKINTEEIEKLRQSLEQEQIVALNQLEDRMRKDHERELEKIKAEMKSRFASAKESKRGEWSSSYSQQREALRARLEHDSRRELERIRSTINNTLDSDIDVYERECRNRLEKERDSEEQQLRSVAEQQLMHKKRSIDLDLKKEHQVELERLRRSIDLESQKELDQYKTNKRSEYERELHESRMSFEAKSQEKLESLRRDLKNKHHKAMSTLMEQLQLDEDRAKIEAREDAEKALARAEKQTKRIAESKTKKQLKDIAVEFERKLEESKNEIKAHNHTELINETNALENKFKAELQEAKLELENQHEKSMLKAKDQLLMEMKHKKTSTVQQMEIEAQSELESLLKCEKLNFEAELNTMKSDFAKAEQEKQDEEIAHIRKEHNLKIEEEKAQQKIKSQEDLKRRIRLVIEEINEDHEKTLKRLEASHEEQKNIRIRDLKRAMQQENEAEYDRFRERSVQAIEATCQQVQDEYLSERRTHMRQIQNELETSYQNALATMENDHTKEIESVRIRKYKELDELISDARNKILQRTLQIQERLRKAFERDARTATNMLRELFGQTEDRKSNTEDGDAAGWLNSSSYVSKLQHQYSVLHAKFTKLSEKLADCGVENSRLRRELNDTRATWKEEVSLQTMPSHEAAKSGVVEKLVSANEELVEKLSNLGKRYTNLEQLFHDDSNSITGDSVKVWSPSPRKHRVLDKASEWISPRRESTGVNKKLFSASQFAEKFDGNSEKAAERSVHISRRGSISITPSSKA